jgi:hypothetical protein
MTPRIALMPSVKSCGLPSRIGNAPLLTCSDRQGLNWDLGNETWWHLTQGAPDRHQNQRK